MNLKVRIGTLNGVLKKSKVKAGDYIESFLKWKSDGEVAPLDLNRIPRPLFDALHGHFQALTIIKPANGERSDALIEAEASLRQLDTYKRILANPSGEKVGRLEGFVQALKLYIDAEAVYRLIYEQEDDGARLLYVVESATYDPPRPKDEIPASATIRCRYIRNGESQSTTWHWGTPDVRGKYIGDILRESGLAVVTKEVFAEYEAEVAQWMDLRQRVGEQFISTGLLEVENRYGSKWQSLEKDGTPSRLVIDEEKSDAVAAGVIYKREWIGTRADADDEDETTEVDEDRSLAIPVQPYLCVFDLSAHQAGRVHVSKLSPYPYDPSCFEKLILPAEVKDLLQILIEGTQDLAEDIVRGKSGGITIASTGGPGLGKTLTAEVFSEMLRRPLYSVQASQLGTTADGLEAELKEVLSRAVRWNAILLLDECDVYTHERGDDIEQNAIVGVFLRVLEYYRGLLFLTTNRGDKMDDAIMSRCVAHVRYAAPGDNLPRVWEVLAGQYRVEFADNALKKGKSVIEQACEAWPQATGRDVKNLLKLAHLLAKRRKTKVDFALLEFVHRFKT